MEPNLNVERINELMERRGLGPGELAYLSGVTYATLYKIRNHERPGTSAEIVGKLASALNCSVDYLLGLTGNAAPYSATAMEGVSELVALASDLTPRRRRELAAIAEAMVRVERDEKLRVRRNIEVNRQLIDMVREAGGDDALDALFDLLGEPSGLGRDGLRRLLDAGLRAGELLRLNIEDIDFDTGAVHVRKGKNRKARTVFLSSRTRRHLRTYLRGRAVGKGAPLFMAATGPPRRLTYEGLRAAIAQRAGKAQVAAPPLHAFRRTFAITSWRNGVDLVALVRLMGQGSLPVLMRYIAAETEELSTIHAQHAPVNNL